jgi:hypothetical protein
VKFMLGNMKSRLKEETNGGKSRGVVMIYSSCEPGKTYGVVLIFSWVVETIWTSEPNSLVSIQALVASFNLFFFREINTTIMIRKRPMIRQDRLILVGLR